ncbi:hypothetical protein [Pontiella sp.]|uniref:hypothetical protein n=1 Tax=Pontiella sp. TaxID=2837462 RepID=UPI003569A4DC
MRTVSVTDGVTDEGQESFRIQTERAVYLYQKTGCAFSSLIDRDGNDWIGYKPKGGPKGHYRGIPNMGYETFGHPGYETGRSELVTDSPDLVEVRSSTADGAWEVEWKIRSTHATMTAHKIAAPVWLLYEGTPGGKFNPKTQFMLFSDGTRMACSETRRAESPDPKWVAFCDPKTKRSLVLAYDGSDSFVDTYWPMDGKGGMTVFGFGRTDTDGFGFYIKTVPFSLSFALVESVSFEEIAAYVGNYLPVRG